MPRIEGKADSVSDNKFIAELSGVNNKVDAKVDDLIQELIKKITIDNVSSLYTLSAKTRKECHSIYEEAAEMHRKRMLAEAKDVQAEQKSWGSHLTNGVGALIPAVVTPLVGGDIGKVVGKGVGGAVTAGGSCLSARTQGNAAYMSALKETESNALQMTNNASSTEEQQTTRYLETAESVRNAAQQARLAMMRG